MTTPWLPDASGPESPAAPGWPGASLDTPAAVIWTPVPPAALFGSQSAAAGASAVPPVELRRGNRVLQVLPLGGGVGQVIRLISAEPADYLNPLWQPGAAILLD